ncbi:MAG: hypothetical protein KAH38_07005 [Candidatus Hydrogenedentes bacterium]|nr:hypothetical protein [Candidatus Hydrogenedentota bacterium]
MNIRFSAPALIFFFIGGMMYISLNATAGEFQGSITSESRFFPVAPLYPEQHGHNLSLSLQGKYRHDWPSRNEYIVFSPFLRLDQHDNLRTHADIRELYWHKSASKWELRLGLCKVFWGVTESQHLVDIINQTDAVEGLSSTPKLGQLMLNFSWIQDWGTFDFYVMPMFRERTFTGRRGRFRTPVPISDNETHYESSAREWHTDFAIRYSHYFGNWDVGVSHFSGTSRSPRYLAHIFGIAISSDSPWANLTGGRIDSPLIRLLSSIPTARLIPYYDQIEQTGIDLQYILGEWTLKLEAIHRSGQERTYTAATGGIEHTFYSVFNSPIDVTAILEYMWDSRGSHALTPMQNDFFFGTRIAFNDVQSTSIVSGTIVDAATGSTAFGIEASRRIGSDWKASIEARIFANIPSNDILTTIHKDDYIQAKLTWYF